MTPPTQGPRWARRLAFEALLRGSNRLIVTTDGSRRGLARRPGMSRRTSVVSVGSNIQVHPISDQERRTLRASICSDPNAPLVVCFGLIRRGKGLEVLIDAIVALHAQSLPVELALVGDVGGAELAIRNAYRAQLLEQQRRLGLENHVHFLGHLPEEKVSTVLQSADLAVLPFLEGVSAGHTTALAILDHGLPLITTKSASTPPEYADAMTLIDAPPATSTLAQAIADLLNDPTRRQVLIAKGKKLADLHSRESIIDQIAHIYIRKGSGAKPR